jgi:hypothetical protein
MIHEITVLIVSITIQRRFYILSVLHTKVFNIWRLTVMDVFAVKNFFIKEELNQYVGHFYKTELKTTILCRHKL